MLQVTGILLLAILGCSFALPSSTLHIIPTTSCGYESCAPTDPNKLNVHLVAHSHDDVGWLKTVDQYYYGSNNFVQEAGIQYIFDTVLDALEHHPDRKFIYVETAFFWKWWLEQEESTQLRVKDLVNQGRIEFIGGAWSMNDEASAHYYSIIDGFAWGLRKLNDTFGACGRPHIGWQIDPFGHSREMASIFAQMGFDGVLFARIDYQDKSNRLSTKTAEMIWEGSSNLGSSADLFTSVLYNHYGPPEGFCFDMYCKDDPIIDDEKSPDYNVDQKVNAFLKFIYRQAKYYTSNNIILTMGSDFHFQDAIMWFKNLDKLIKYVNAADEHVNVIYSTPSCYLKAVNEAGLTYTTKQDDFFPYATDGNSYWTGFYTSRPTSKYFERLGNNFLQVTKQLTAMTQLGQMGDSPVDSLREAMGVFQHHDAITGTEKQHVADDYARMLASAIEDARSAAETAINAIVSDGTKPLTFQNCLKLNVSVCSASENEQFVVTVYNPLSHTVNHTVRIPVTKGTFVVLDADGQEQKVQLLPIPDFVLNLPERQGSLALHDLVFTAQNLPPLGLRSYHVSKSDITFNRIEASSDVTIGNKNLQVTLDEITGLVKSIVINGEERALDQNFYYYDGYVGDNSDASRRASGAYVFRPIRQEPKVVSSSAKFQVYKGIVIFLLLYMYGLIRKKTTVEFDWVVGPIPIEEEGKEVVTRFTTNLKTDGIFYTDSNGRELLERKRDYRPTWNLEVTEPVSGNYYPITSKILIRDSEKAQELAIFTDRAQGGSSVNDGQLELMVHRRLLYDDAFGVAEPLNEMAFGKGLIAKGTHYVMAGNTNSDSPNLAAQEREFAIRKILSPWLFFTPTDLSYTEYQSTYKMKSHLNTPPNIVLHTLEPWGDDTLLFRLEHILEVNEDSELSKPVVVNYKDKMYIR
ncbi:hypothetical protein L9F63_001515, partial [Diploptera punctata]